MPFRLRLGRLPKPLQKIHFFCVARTLYEIVNGKDSEELSELTYRAHMILVPPRALFYCAA
jgi:hypothetical protein